MSNKLPSNIDPTAWIEAFEKMSPLCRRWAFIAAKMAEKNKTFAEIASPEGITGWYVGASAQGRTALTPRVVKALEKGLDIDLSPFLSPDEAAKVRRYEVRAKLLSK
jgi:hypothetical protein